MGGTEGHPKERPGESERGGHPGHTDKTREREREAGGRDRNEGRKRGYQILAWCSSKHFSLVMNYDAD